MNHKLFAQGILWLGLLGLAVVGNVGPGGPSEAPSQKIYLDPGRNVLLAADDIARVQVQDDTLLTASMVKPGLIQLRGRRAGITTLHVWTRSGQRQSWQVRLEKTARPVTVGLPAAAAAAAAAAGEAAASNQEPLDPAEAAAPTGKEAANESSAGEGAPEPGTPPPPGVEGAPEPGTPPPPGSEGNQGTEGEQPPVGEGPGPTEPGTRRFEPTGPLPPGVKLDDGNISLEFKKADINQFLDVMGEVWGRTIVADASLEGTINIEGMTNVSPETAFEVFKAVLSVKGFAVVGTLKDNVIKVLPVARIPSQPSEVRIGTPLEEIKGGDDILTYVRALNYLDASKIKSDLQPLVSAEGAALVAVTSTNHLIITDFQSNVRRLIQILEQLDQQPEENRELKVIKLENANAAEIEQLLEQLFQDQTQAMVNRFRQQFGGGGPPGMGGPPGGGGGGPGGNLQSLLQQGRLDLLGQVSISSDERTNSLVIYASPQNQQAIADIVKQLDVNLAPLITYRVFKLENADATTAADQLNQMFEQTQEGTSRRTSGRSIFGGFGPGMFSPFGRSQQQARPGFTGLLENVVIADTRTNSLVVTATEENMKIYEQIIREIDAETGLQDMTDVYPLQYAVATELVDTLNEYFRGQRQQQGGFAFFLFGNQQQQGSPQEIFQQVTVVAEEKTNSILITAPPQALPEVKRIIERLDQPLPQVYIHVVIVDATLTKENKLGFEWKWLNALDDESSVGTDFGIFNETTGFKYSLINNDFTATLHALATDSNVKVLSTPHITTLNNVQAGITIGQDYPFVESFITDARGNITPQFKMERIAIELNVTPHINLSSQTITLDVQQNINDVAGLIQQGQVTQPIVAVREANTSIRVQHGQTIIIGGIMRNREEIEKKVVPILGDLLKNIPIIGELFKSKRKKREKSELMVFMTPFIVMTEEEVNTIKQKYEDRLGQFFKTPPKVSPDILDPFARLDAEEEEKRPRVPVSRPLRPQEMEPKTSLSDPFSAPFALPTPPPSIIGALELVDQPVDTDPGLPGVQLRQEKVGGQ